MVKTIFDVIQRFEVENGVPRLISTNIQVIEGGEDLMSSATSLLVQLGFHDKFQENRTSQYIGYKLKNPRKGAKRYQLVLTPRKEGLCISVSRDVLEPDILCLKYFEFNDDPDVILGKFWIIPSKEDIFFASIQTHYPDLLKGEVTGTFFLNEGAYFFYRNCHNYHNYDSGENLDFIKSPKEFDIKSLGSYDCYLVINEDKLFPHTLQVCISSREILEEFLSHFTKILMEQP